MICLCSLAYKGEDNVLLYPATDLCVRGVPVGKHALLYRFNKALERIGVTEAQRRDRGPVFFLFGCFAD